MSHSRYMDRRDDVGDLTLLALCFTAAPFYVILFGRIADKTSFSGPWPF